ncbi:MAG: hypothetical protein RMM98_12155 [Acidobacteriota bacterium]|nr:hypothetical protein [Blastocatellia bacterium]MDW8240362.1 hypothetical protein [Acidobacteriota bacterium]
MTSTKSPSTLGSRCWRLAGWSFLASLVTATAVSAQIRDPLRDHEAPADVTAINAQAEPAEGIKVTLDFASNVTPTFVCYLFVDADRDLTSSASNVSTVPGIDVLIKLVHGLDRGNVFNRVEVITEAGVQVFFPPKSDKVRVSIADNVLMLKLAKELLGGATVVDFFVCVDTGEVGDMTFDRVPDVGLIDYSAGRPQVKLAGTSRASIDVILHDEPRDAAFPDLASLELRVVGDRLRVTLTFIHSVEGGRDFPAGSKILGQVFFDIDQRLVTGFSHGGESPPLLGADYGLKFILDPRASLEPVILSFSSRLPGRSAPAELQMGLAHRNDCQARRAGRSVTFDVPLVLLGDFPGDVLVRADCQAIPSGASDGLPNQMILAAASRSLRPLPSCTSPPISADDPVDASAGSLNDELIQVKLCLCTVENPNGPLLLIEIAYTDLQKAAGTATTSLFIDTDQNVATGLLIENAGQRIGADYVLSFGIIQPSARVEPTANVQLQRIGAQPQVYNQLTSFAFTPSARTVTTLPLSLLGQDDGAMDLLVITHHGGNRLDVVPNTGIIRVPRL